MSSSEFPLKTSGVELGFTDVKAQRRLYVPGQRPPPYTINLYWDPETTKILRVWSGHINPLVVLRRAIVVMS